GRRHGLRPDRDQPHRVLVAQHTRERGGGELAHAVPGAGVGGGEAVLLVERGGGDDARRHQQRLGHGGGAEGLGSGVGAVAEQVGAGRGRERRERLIGARQLAPRGQEAGLRRPWSGTDDREHGNLQRGRGDGPLARGDGPMTGEQGRRAVRRRRRAARRGDQDSPPNEPDSPAFTFVRSYLSMAWRTTDGSTVPSLASSWRALTTIECASIFRWRRAAGRVSEKPQPSAPSTP